MYTSQANQDQFVDFMLNNKQFGTYVDIGSYHPIEDNNTYVFDARGWSGICVDLQLDEQLYSQTRSAYAIKSNALSVNYLNLFQRMCCSSTIDYLSIDVDESSTKVLEMLPHDQYRFNVITIEHDAYVHGDKYRTPQRELLTSLGYILFTEDVKVPESVWNMMVTEKIVTNKLNVGFEDWWISPYLA